MKIWFMNVLQRRCCLLALSLVLTTTGFAQPLTEYVDIEKLSGDILYENCSSTLEFFIVSLCKNFKIKPIQAIGLLSNNRQYLSVMCRSGINGNYITIKKWLEDLQINYDVLLSLIFKYEDGVYMTYCIIGTALCSKNYDISFNNYNAK